MPRAASKQAPDMRPCSRSSGRGASPNLPSGSDPITLKYVIFHQSITVLELSNVKTKTTQKTIWNKVINISANG